MSGGAEGVRWRLPPLLTSGPPRFSPQPILLWRGNTVGEPFSRIIRAFDQSAFRNRRGGRPNYSLDDFVIDPSNSRDVGVKD
jgi:hypothetical protein